MTGLIITGWAHHPSSLVPLADQLRPNLQCELYAPYDLLGSLAIPRAKTDGVLDVMVGWSLGGLIALSWVAEQRLKVGCLVLIASTARFLTAPDYAYGVTPSLLRSMKVGLQRNPTDTLRQFKQQACAPETPSENDINQFVEVAMGYGVPTLIRALDYLAETDVRKALSELNTPLLVLHGDKDMIIPWTASEYIARRVPHAQLNIFHGSGHNLPLAAPSRVAQKINDFLQYVAL